MLLQKSYRLFAPFYDLFVNQPTLHARRSSLAPLHQMQASRILLSGAGTGLDLPLLPKTHCYYALDVTASMLEKARQKTGNLKAHLVQGDSMALPFADDTFDVVVLHLIVAVVPDSVRCLSEATRVLKPGGTILLFDKFLKRGERAWLRRSIGLLTGKIMTRTNVVFEDVLEQIPMLVVHRDESALAGGWFRLIELRKCLA